MENIRNIDACRMAKQHITGSNYKKKREIKREGERVRERVGLFHYFTIILPIYLCGSITCITKL